MYLDFIYFIVLVFAIPKAFTFDIANQTQNDRGSSRILIGLPIGTWKIIDLDSAQKDTICNQQKLACSNECGGQGLVLKNFCNKITMAWGCTCQKYVPSLPPYSWPITVAECQGKENSCFKGCDYYITKESCMRRCSKFYRCNLPGSLPSGLQVEDEDVLPQYNLPIHGSPSSSSSIFRQKTDIKRISLFKIFLICSCSFVLF